MFFVVIEFISTQHGDNFVVKRVVPDGVERPRIKKKSPVSPMRTCATASASVICFKDNGT
jgi:hypothetical protein